MKPTKNNLLNLVEDVLGRRKPNLTVQEFANITGLSHRTIRQECASGRLPAYQSHVGAPYLIFFEHLDKYMEMAA